VNQDGERQFCEAETSAGVVLKSTTGTGQCLLGKTWGYDDDGIWVDDGCGGEFGVKSEAGLVVQEGEPTGEQTAEEEYPSWGTYTPGTGWLIGRSRDGEVNLSAYGVIRYLNQNDDDEVFTDHLGNERTIDLRNDIFGHRVIVFLTGWLASPKFRYIFLWTVSSTDYTRSLPILAPLHCRSALGDHPNPGSRLKKSHPPARPRPRWRTSSSARTSPTGSGRTGNWFQVSGTRPRSGTTRALSESPRPSSTTSWTRGAFRCGGCRPPRSSAREGRTEIGSTTMSSPRVSGFRRPRARKLDSSTPAPRAPKHDPKLADGVNLFETGSLEPGVTIQEAGYKNLAFDAGMKYKGIFLQAEYYFRWLDDFEADGPLPVQDLYDHGFYVQAAGFPIPEKLELYAVTSQIYGDPDAGFDDSSEYVCGLNYYPFGSRNYRWNLQLMNVNHSPVSSSFGYYVGGQDGTSITTAFSIFY
jgi:hypothetical protein